MRQALSALLCAITLVSTAPVLAQGYSPDQLFAIGKSYATRGEDDKAIDLLQQALKGGTKSAAEAEYLLALCLSRQERLPEAAAHLDRSLELDPKRYGAWLLLGMTKDLSGDPAGAAAAYRKAIALEPKPSEAVGALRQALELKPGQADVMGDLGYALLLERECEQAAGVLAEARKADPRNPATLAHLGDAEACLGKTDLAIEAYEAALALEPDRARTLFHLGLMRSKKGDKPGAKAALERAAALDPANPKIKEALRRLSP